MRGEKIRERRLQLHKFGTTTKVELNLLLLLLFFSGRGEKDR